MNKTFTSFVSGLFLALGAFAQQTVPAGCTASPNFSAEAYTVWTAEAVKQVSSQVSAESPQINISQRIEVELYSSESENSGFVRFQIPSEGTYVIATDAYPRMNLTDVASGENLDPVDFGKISDCGTVSKALRFEFTKPREIILELVSRKSPLLNILIWRLN